MRQPRRLSPTIVGHDGNESVGAGPLQGNIGRLLLMDIILYVLGDHLRRLTLTIREIIIRCV